jgi:hypothetical protein
VRTVLAALLSGLIAVTVTADPFACPDGCNDEPPARTATHGAAPCAFCLGWSPSPITVPGCPLSLAVARRPQTPLTSPAPALPTLDPPPKAA